MSIPKVDSASLSRILPPASTSNKKNSTAPNNSQIQLSRELNDSGHFINGVVANCVMVGFMQPFFAAKTYLMSGKGLPPISKLYSGVVINAASGGPAEGVTFLTHNLFTKLFKNGNEEPNNWQKLIVSAASGAIGATAISPCERTMILQQLNNGTVKEVLTPVIAKEGVFKTFTKGYVPAAIRDAKFNCGVFALNNIAQDSLKDIVPNKEKRELVASGLTGSFVGALSTPFDRIKTMMQADTNGEYTSMTQTAKKIVGKTGVRSLFDGAGPRAFLIAGATYWMAKSRDEAPKFFPNSCFKQN